MNTSKPSARCVKFLVSINVLLLAIIAVEIGWPLYWAVRNHAFARYRYEIHEVLVTWKNPARSHHKLKIHTLNKAFNNIYFGPEVASFAALRQLRKDVHTIDSTQSMITPETVAWFWAHLENVSPHGRAYIRRMKGLEDRT